MDGKHILARAIAAFQVAAQCGGDLDIPEYQACLAGLRSMRDRITARNDSLNIREIPPTGDDYNYLLDVLCFPVNSSVAQEILPKGSYQVGQRFEFAVSQAVICNGFEGAVAEVHSGQLQGMVSVRLDSGSVTVSASYPDCYPAEVDRTHLLQPWKVRYGSAALEFRCMAEGIAHAIEQCERAYPEDKVVSATLEAMSDPHTHDSRKG